MSSVISRLDYVAPLGGVVVAAVLWPVVEPLVAVAAGCVVVAVLVLAVVCARLSRAVGEITSHAGPAPEPPSPPDVDAVDPTPAGAGDAKADELLRRGIALSSQWQDAARATAEFRRGLVGELAASFDDLQSRVDRLAEAVEQVTAGSVAVPAVGDEAAADLPQIEAARREIVGLKKEVRAIPRSAEMLHQVEAIVTLRVMMRDVPLPLPVSGGWRASPTTLMRYLELIATERPALVVECGSGASSLWAGHRLRQVGGGRCVALEHDPHFVQESSALVASHELDDIVDVRLAPLTPSPAPWYDSAAWADLEQIDLVFVDGPPGPVAPQARRPALEMLGPRMRPGGHILVDDADRADEASLIAGWVATGLVREVESSVDYKGWAVLQYVGAGPL